jgi:hypothetical protein
MPVETTPVIGAKSYLYLMSETTWGTKDASQRVFIPTTDYGVQFQSQVRQAKPYLGIYQRKHSKRRQGMPAGAINTNLYGYQFGVDEGLGGTTVAPGSSISLAEYLLDWSIIDEAGTLPEASTMPSKTAEWAEGPDISNVEHNGLRVNQATLAGSDSSGVLALNLDVQGKSDAALATATAPPDDMEKLTEFEFPDLIFKLDDGAGGALAQLFIASFQLQVQYSNIIRYNNSDNPTAIIKGDRMVTMAVTLDKENNDYDVVRRLLSSETDFVAQVILQGLNNGTGSAAWTIGTLDVPLARYVNHQDQRNRDSIFQQPLQFICLKPDNATNDLSIAWTAAAAKSS